MEVAVLVNEISSTSIPLEIAIHTEAETDADVTVFSFYDDDGAQFDPDVAGFSDHIVALGADSRVDLGAYRKLRRHLSTGNFDILHTHHNSTGSLARLAVAGTGITIVDTEHNDHRHFSHLQKVVNSVTFPLVDTIVSNSESTARSFAWYERILAMETDQRVVYNGIDGVRIDSAGPPPVELPDTPTVVTIGRLVEQKNFKTLLHAFREVVEEVPSADLVVIGDGPLLADLRSLSVQLGIQNSTTFTGYLDRRDDVYGVLKRSTMAVFPSWYEGFCVAAVEAMASGLPVVVSDIDVFREVVGEAGVYADPEEPMEFAAAVADLLTDPNRRDELGHAAHERAKSTFSLDRTVQEYYNAYKEAVKIGGQ